MEFLLLEENRASLGKLRKPPPPQVVAEPWKSYWENQIVNVIPPNTNIVGTRTDFVISQKNDETPIVKIKNGIYGKILSKDLDKFKWFIRTSSI